jgi:hypothetical protein
VCLIALVIIKNSKNYVIYQFKIVNEVKQQQQTSAVFIPQTTATSTIMGEARGASTSFTAAEVTWTPLVQDMLKCNVNAAIFREQNCFGAGMCLRDDSSFGLKQHGTMVIPLHKKQRHGVLK